MDGVGLRDFRNNIPNNTARDTAKGLLRAGTKVFLPGLDSAITGQENGNDAYSVKGFVQANRLPDARNDFEASVRAIKDLVDKKIIYNPGTLTPNGYKLNEFGFFKYSFTEDWLKKSAAGRAALEMDKTLLDVKFIKDAFNKVFPKADLKTIINPDTAIAEKFIAGTNGTLQAGRGATTVARALGRIPVINVIISTALEVPAIIKAAKNGDGIQQTGRSVINIACTTAGSAILGALLTPIIPPVGSLVGAAIGGVVGNAVGDKVGKFLFGEPKPEKQDLRNLFMQNNYTIPNYYNVNKGIIA